MISAKGIAMTALATYGASNQECIALEEMAELNVALFHLRRGKSLPRDVQAEIADVCIAMESMKHIYGYDEVEKIMAEKMARLKRRIDDENLKRHEQMVSRKNG